MSVYLLTDCPYHENDEIFFVGTDFNVAVKVLKEKITECSNSFAPYDKRITVMFMIREFEMNTDKCIGTYSIFDDKVCEFDFISEAPGYVVNKTID